MGEAINLTQNLEGLFKSVGPTDFVFHADSNLYRKKLKK